MDNFETKNCSSFRGLYLLGIIFCWEKIVRN